MNLLPSSRTRYLLLFVSLLSMVALIEALAKAVSGFGGFGFALTLWACFGAAYGWMLVEPMIRALLLKRLSVDVVSLHLVKRIGARVAHDSGSPTPRFYVYDSTKFDVMVTGIGKGVTIMVSGTAARLDEIKLRSVLAHEFGHIRQKHAVVRVALYGSLLTLAIIGNSTALVALPANFFVLWTMRQMEFAADREAARVVGAGDFKEALAHVASVLGDIPAWQSVFSTHPSFRARISRLS